MVVVAEAEEAEEEEDKEEEEVNDGLGRVVACRQ